MLGNAVQTRQWHIEGLPADSFSVENALIMEESRYQPLIIDPQGIAREWLSQREGYAEFQRVVVAGDPHILEKVAPAITLGRMVIVDEVGDGLTPAVESLVDALGVVAGGGGRRRASVTGRGREISLGNDHTVVEFNPDFRLYLLTRLRNPHFLPEVQTRVTMINFQLTPGGLQERLLSIVVSSEIPAVEKERKAVVVKSAANKREMER